ncbi:dimethyl sulfoxide reductase membrane subunit [Gammaproteobacteria bacterium]
MMKKVYYRQWSVDDSVYWMILGFLALVAAVGGLSSLYMEHFGHWVTGMNNQVVWGIPHVFAIFLIVAASGALNVASIGSVFGRASYKPLARLSALLSIALLVGGLLVLVLDLGRPDRLEVAMTNYNFKSIFAWNIYLYSGFLAIVVVYLWTMMERSANGYSKSAGLFAFVWRLALTTGTGSIFGFLVSRQAYDSALLAPMFIIMSFSFGLAIFILVMMLLYHLDGGKIGQGLFSRLKNLLGVFVAAVLYFMAVYHLTNLYAAKKDAVEYFLLFNGGIYSRLFWIGHVFVGSLLPLGIIHHPVLGKSRKWIAGACGMVVLGGLAIVYVIVVGGQAFPMQLFPDMTLLDSGFYDGVQGAVAGYNPTMPEFLLGLGGAAVALAITAVGVRVLQFLPESLEDDHPITNQESG